MRSCAAGVPDVFKMMRWFFAFLMILPLVRAAQPNVLWIVSDDLSPELGCYGYAHVATPNIDRLAAEGRRYDHAFSSAPVCSASRSAFITGMYQTSIASYHHRTEDVKRLPTDVVPLPERLRAAGYWVCNGQDPGGKRRGKVDYNFQHDAKQLFQGSNWEKRKPGQPFFAQIQIKEPHRPFVAQPVVEERHLTAPLPPIYADHPLARRDWQAYLLSIEVLDRKVGEVLDQLEAEGLTENTVVFFFGDHGRPMVRGKQWLYEGGLWVPLLVRWPGHIEAGSVEEGLVSLIDLVPTVLDMTGVPKTGRIQGQSFWPEPVRTRIFAARDRCGDANDRIRAVRTDRFKYIRNFMPEQPYTIRSSYKEMGYPMLPLMRHLHSQGKLNPVHAAFFAPKRPVEELYDVAADPWETRNLAADPEYAEQLQELREEVETWMEETGDEGGTPETNPTLEEIQEKGRATTWDRPLQQRGLPNPPTDEDLIRWWTEEYARHDRGE